MPLDFDLTQTEILEHLKALEKQWGGWLKRSAVTRALSDGDWDKVFVDEKGMPETQEPLIANLFRLTIEDGGRLFAEATPMDRTDAAKDDEKKRAEIREAAIVGFNSTSEIYDQLEYLGQDMLATGLTGILVWPEMSKPLAKRFPTFRRLEPETLLPEPRWTPYQPTEECAVHYTWPIRKLRREFARNPDRYLPGAQEAFDQMWEDIERRKRTYRGVVDLSQIGDARFRHLMPQDMEMLDIYSTDRIVRICLYREGEYGGEFARAVPLLDMENPTGICPVQLSARSTWSKEPRGQMDDTKGVTRLRNRYYRVIFDYFVQMVYADDVVYGVELKEGQRVHRAVQPDFKVERLGPQNMSYQVLQILDIMEKEDRSGKVAPLSREGEVDLNKATAAFLTRAQGQLNSVVKSLQRNFAATKRRANEVALAQDEFWCNAKKEITGKARGRRFRVTYTPKEEIDGDYQNRVTYGTSTGLDKPTHQVVMLQKLGVTMSLETFLENDPDIDDAALEMARLAREKQVNIIFGGLEKEPTLVQIKVLAILNRAVANSTPTEEVIEELEKAGIMVPPQQPALPAGMPALPAGMPPGLGPPGVAEAEQAVPERLPQLPEPVRRAASVGR